MLCFAVQKAIPNSLPRLCRGPLTTSDGLIETLDADSIGAERTWIGMNSPVTELAAFPPVTAFLNQPLVGVQITFNV
jgi:hypothetical protein